MTHAENFRNRGAGRRTGRDRRAAAERRAAERRERQKAAVTDRRAGLDRRAAARRSEAARRRARDRRHERFGFGPIGVLGSMEPASNASRPHTTRHTDEITARDRSRARRLPEEFLASSGSAMDRLSKVIRHAWPRHPLPIRAAMAEMLLPLLAPLLTSDGMAVTQQVRNDCEEAAVQGLQIRAH